MRMKPILLPTMFCEVVIVVTILSSLQCECFQIRSLMINNIKHTNEDLPSRSILKVKALHNDNDNQQETNMTEENPKIKGNDVRTSRRSLLMASSLLTLPLLVKMEPANAGLVQFPCDYNLMNTYHLMRAGESLLESEGILSTNPLFLTNRNDALSPNGIEQVEAASRNMLERDINPSVLKYSLAAKSMDTANIIATQMLVGRNRLIPEYTFMDPRGVGLWDMQQLSDVEEAVWALDHDQAGENGDGGKPPATDDSTPNETLSSQAIRLRQLMSVLETQFSGDTILLVFPDGASPALLMCLMAGIPLNRVHEFNFKPGEIRFDVTMNTILNSMNNEENEEYISAIERGREKLKKARANPRQFIDIEEEGNNYYQPLIRTKNHEENMNKEVSPSQRLALVGMSILGLLSNKLNPNEDLDIQDHQDELEGNLPTIGDGIENAPELHKMEELIVKAPFEIPEMSKKDDDKERVEKANIAMDEYLNKDDGGEDWISMMSDLMHDENDLMHDEN